MARRQKSNKRQSQKGKYYVTDTWSIPIKAEIKKVWSKKQGKDIEVVNRSFTLSSGRSFYLFDLQPTDEKTLAETGIGYFISAKHLQRDD